MDDQALDFRDPADRFVGRLLQAYGEDRLSPSIAASTRMRMAVMGTAHRRAALIEADATFDAAGETTSARAAKRARAARNAWRRPVAAVLAGTLTLGFLAGTAFTTRPGGPFYGARLWTEMANLPAGLADRAQAEGHRLEQRIQEAQQASTAGDETGTEAALVAYSKIVVEAAKGTDRDPAASATLEVTVTRHVVVLTQMVDSVPAPVRAAAEAALTSTSVALDDLSGAVQNGDQSHAPSRSRGIVGSPSGGGQTDTSTSPTGTTPEDEAVDDPQSAGSQPGHDTDGLTSRPWPSERPHGPSIDYGQHWPAR